MCLFIKILNEIYFVFWIIFILLICIFMHSQGAVFIQSGLWMHKYANEMTDEGGVYECTV